jgi:hypothetical protein
MPGIADKFAQKQTALAGHDGQTVRPSIRRSFA